MSKHSDFENNLEDLFGQLGFGQPREGRLSARLLAYTSNDSENGDEETETDESLKRLKSKLNYSKPWKFTPEAERIIRSIFPKDTKSPESHFSGYRSRIFLQEAPIYEHAFSESSDSVPFFSESIPIYSDLNNEQLDYYFSWREAFRRGEFRKTDGDYILLLTQELINRFGTDNDDLINKLTDLLTLARDSEWKKDYLLSTVLADCIVLLDQQESFRIFDEIERFDFEKGFGFNSGYINLYLKIHMNDTDPFRFPISILSKLSRFRFLESPVIMKWDKDNYLKTLQDVLFLIDHKEKRDNNQGILAKASAPSHSFSNRIFKGFAYNGSFYNYYFAPDFLGSDSLKTTLTNLVKFTDNELRSFLHIHGRLKVGTLGKAEKKLIHTFIQTRFNENEQKPVISKVVLDFDTIEKVREESETVRKALEILEETESKLLDLNPVEDSTGGIADNKSEPSLKAFLEALDISRRTLLKNLLAGKEVGEELNSLAENEFKLPETIIEEINEQALNWIDDILIESAGESLSLVPEYLEKLKENFDFDDE